MAYDAYITSADYTDIYKGQPIAAADFGRIALRASDEIDKLTLRKIRQAGLASFSTDHQELIKLAACAMAEGLNQLDQATDGTGVVASSEKIGSYSYSVEASAVLGAFSAAVDRASEYLLFTGLLYRGVSYA